MALSATTHHQPWVLIVAGLAAAYVSIACLIVMGIGVTMAVLRMRA